MSHNTSWLAPVLRQQSNAKQQTKKSKYQDRLRFHITSFLPLCYRVVLSNGCNRRPRPTPWDAVALAKKRGVPDFSVLIPFVNSIHASALFLQLPLYKRTNAENRTLANDPSCPKFCNDIHHIF
jgi:hypothetical protein